MKVYRVAGGAEIAPARHHARTGNQSLVDRTLQRDIYIVRGARADCAGESASQEQLRILRRDQGGHRHRMLQVDLGEGRYVVIGHVEVTLDHSRHQRAAGEVVNDVVSRSFGSVPIRGDHSDALTFDHDGGILLWRVAPIDQICAAKESASHFRFPPSLAVRRVIRRDPEQCQSESIGRVLAR
jgi:hypothetical protein